jgi:TonB-dependent starch-binding outer membrane protein SusC
MPAANRQTKLFTNKSFKFMKKKFTDGRITSCNFPNKIFLVMKFTLILLIASALNLFATGTYSQNTKLSLELRNITVKEALKTIEKSSEFFFIYNNELINVNRKVDVVAKNQKISEILNSIFKAEPVEITVIDRKIILAPEAFAGKVASKTVTGMVTDSKNGEPLPGATIKLKGTSTGVICDLDGKFTIEIANDDAVLIVSFVGYTTQEIVVGNSLNLNIQLEPDTKNLDEVVVIGYGTQKKGDVTSSVSNVKSENFNKGAMKDIGQLVQGKVAGLAITNTSGDPTSTTQIKLRGTNTIGGANTDPLVLVDGIPGNLNTVAPEDVETIDVLKDGSAAAIYGTRGTNGVILITTKQFKSKGGGVNKVEYNAYISTSQIAKKLDMLNADEFRALYPAEDHKSNTNWLNEITRTPLSHVHNLSFQGGTSSTNYIATANYNSAEGIMLKSGNQTFQGRFQINHTMFDDKLQFKFGLIGKMNEFPSTSNNGSFNGYTYRQAILHNPTDPVKNADGSWYENTTKFEYDNPVSRLEECNGNVKNTEMRYNANVVYRPIADLTLSTVLSYVRSNRNYGYSETLNHISTLRDGLNGWSAVGANTFMEKVAEITALYNKQIEEHKFSILGGYSYNETDYESMDFSNYGFQDDYFGGWNNIGIGSALKLGKAGAGSSKSTSNLIGFFGRGTYSYMDKYLLMASIRYEEASQLWGTNNEWGRFPSVSLGWRISKESFMKNQQIFDDLKLRVGYGVTGSQPKNAFLGVAMLKYDKYAYVNGKWVQTIVPASNANPDLKWEEKKETNIGLDFSSLKGRLSGSVELYNRKVDGLIYDYPVPTPPNLFSSTTANGGVMENKGIEIMLSAIPVQIKDFEWITNVTFSTNKNKLKSLDGSVFKSNQDFIDVGWLSEPVKTNSHRVQVGEKIGNFWGYKVVDVDADGNWVYEDKDGKHVSYGTGMPPLEDKKVIGNGLPSMYAGWNNTLRYKNFDLNITMRGAFGYQIINEARMYYENPRNSRKENRLESVNDLIFGKATLNKGKDPEFNSYYVEDGDYWKIDNITLGYTLNKVGRYCKSIRFYGSVTNTFTITGYKGVDPEVNMAGLNPGQDGRDQYPSTRIFTFGVNVKF